MTTTTLPRIAAELDLCSGTWYAAESTMAWPDEHLIVWLPTPRIPAGAEGLYHWAEADARIATPHVTLDTIAMAKLLYIGPGEPAELDDADALDAIDAALCDVHCDMLRCSARIANGALDGPRWRRCEQRAARLAEVSN